MTDAPATGNVTLDEPQLGPALRDAGRRLWDQLDALGYRVSVVLAVVEEPRLIDGEQTTATLLVDTVMGEMDRRTVYLSIYDACATEAKK